MMSNYDDNLTVFCSLFDCLAPEWDIITSLSFRGITDCKASGCQGTIRAKVTTEYTSLFVLVMVHVDITTTSNLSIVPKEIDKYASYHLT